MIVQRIVESSLVLTPCLHQAYVTSAIRVILTEYRVRRAVATRRHGSGNHTDRATPIFYEAQYKFY